MSVRDNTYGIAPLQEKMLNIFKHFQSICEKEHMDYWAGTGTCLGAIRHQGFIPWDDDMDIYMPRKDYEKLWEKWNEINTNTSYVLCRTTREKNYRHRAMQIVDINTTFVNVRCANDDIEHGVYIDIIPMDGCPTSTFSRISQIINTVIYSVYNIQIPPDFQGGKVMRFSTRLLLSIIRSPDKRYKIWKKAEDKISKYNIDSCELCADLYIYFWMVFRPMPKEWFETVEVPFEDTVIRVPAGYDSYLKTLYGDYMKLPPQKDRNTKHNTVFIDVEHPYIDYKGVYYLRDSE